MSNMQNIVIYGSGGWAREVLGIIEMINQNQVSWNILGFLDDDPKQHGAIIAGQRVLGGSNWLADKRSMHVVIGIGSSIARKQIAERLSYQYDILFPILKHPLAYVGPRVQLGEGTVLHAYSVATVDLNMGRHNLLNVGAMVSHGNRIADYVSIHPHCNVSGDVTLSEGVELGTGTDIIQGTSVGSYSIVGAGSVVVKPIEECCVAVGAPAKAIKRLAPPIFGFEATGISPELI